MTDPEDPPNNDDQWGTLLAQYELLQAASAMTWRALLEAYKHSADGAVRPDSEAMVRYKNASALRLAAEQALIRYIESRSKQ